MGAGVADFIDLGDLAVGIDEERHALWVARILFVRSALDAVRETDPVIDVGQQRVFELLGCRECLVLRGCIERGADDLDVVLSELLASITEALTFASSTAGRRFWVPPQHDP